MSNLSVRVSVFAFLLASILNCGAQQGGAGQSNPANSQPGQSSGSTQPATQQQVATLQTQIDKIKTDLEKQQDPDFGVTLGVGSLVINSDVTDYSNASNVLQANSLGRATPQYLVGISMRTHVPNFHKFGPKGANCTTASTPNNAPADQSAGSNAGAPSSGATLSQTDPKAAAGSQQKGGTAGKATAAPPDGSSNPGCEVWRRRPWEAFISLKFSPQSSQTINGYVLGGSWAIARYLDVMIGYALTPINEAAPGFRVAASNYVIQQQKNGLDMNFNPTAMLNNQRDAFDGFPITDTNGKLIYPGSPLEIHYRGGAVFGVSVPINFGALFSTKSQ